MANISSEAVKDMTPEQQEELQGRIKNMSADDLKEFRNSFNPDEMGFDGKEAI